MTTTSSSSGEVLSEADAFEREQHIKEQSYNACPLIGSFQATLEGLRAVYVTNTDDSELTGLEASPAVFAQKLAALATHLQTASHSLGWRAVRGDGNCCFRAYAFLFFERLGDLLLSPSDHDQDGDEDATCLTLLSKHADVFAAVRKLAGKAEARFDVVGFERLVMEDFTEAFHSLLTSCEQALLPVPKADGAGAASLSLPSLSHYKRMLEEQMNDPDVSNSIVVYFRFIASAFLRLHADTYEPFLAFPTLPSAAGTSPLSEGQPSMAAFCANRVEAFGQESDDLCLTALANAFLVPIHVHALDAHPAYPFQVFPFDPASECVDTELAPARAALAHPPILLLYRPGHYDILYQ